jgi:hypothetical protein
MKSTITVTSKGGKIIDSIDFRKLIMVFFLERLNSETRVQLYLCLIYCFKSTKDIGVQLQLEFPQSSSAVQDKTMKFLGVEDINSVYLGEKYNLIKEQITNNSLAGLHLAEQRINWLKKVIPDGHDVRMASFSKGKKSKKPSLLMFGSMDYDKTNHKAVLTHPLVENGGIPESIDEMPEIGNWLKAEWKYYDGYPDEINLDFSLRFDVEEEISLGSFTTYVVCHGGYSLKDASPSFSMKEKSTELPESRGFQLVRRHDYRNPNYLYFPEWEALGIRDSEMFRNLYSDNVVLTLKEGITGVDLLLRFSDEGSQSRRDLRFLIVTVILALMVPFISPIENIYIKNVWLIGNVFLPKVLLNMLPLGALLTFSYQVVYSFTLNGKIQNWFNRVLSTFVVLGIVIYYFCVERFTMLSNPLIQLVLIASSFIYTYLIFLAVNSRRRKKQELYS